MALHKTFPIQKIRNTFCPFRRRNKWLKSDIELSIKKCLNSDGQQFKPISTTN